MLTIWIRYYLFSTSKENKSKKFVGFGRVYKCNNDDA